jgi:hypothetical protein
MLCSTLPLRLLCKLRQQLRKRQKQQRQRARAASTAAVLVLAKQSTRGFLALGAQRHPQAQQVLEAHCQA